MINAVPQALFGPGILWATRTDLTLQTPTNIGFVNEFSFDMKYSVKELYGQNQLPLVVARGTAKVSGKIKAATLSGQALNSVLLGQTWTSGTQYGATTSPSTAIPATPFQITPTVPNTGTWNADLGVVNASTGEPLTLVTGTPAAGQYAVAAGVYTFASADHTSNISVYITFAYTWTTGATGQNMVIANQPIGTTPSFQLDYMTSLYGSIYYIRLYNCVCGGVSLQHKLEDFAMPEYEFSAFANNSQQLGLISLATAA